MIEQSSAQTGSPRSRSLLDGPRDWLQSRGVDVVALTDTALHVEIPAGVRTYFLGGMTLFFLIVQVITGILLTLYYRPSSETAYQSILYIMNEVRFGWLIRSIHAWSANLMILACVLHLARVYFQGAYKKPREMTWTVGVFLLLLTMGFGFTGSLLPWDQRAFWATTVGTEIAGAVPGFGELALIVLRDGWNVTGQTLSRFYAAHVMILPIFLLALMGLHFLMVRRQGIAKPL